MKRDTSFVITAFMSTINIIPIKIVNCTNRYTDRIQKWIMVCILTLGLVLLSCFCIRNSCLISISI